MACHIDSGDVRIAVCCGRTCFGMFRNGIVHDIVLYCQSDIFCHSWRNIRQMWNLPLVSSIAFLVGTWLFFDIKEVWFIIYAAVYLIIGWTAMGISKYLNNQKKI